MRLINLPDLVGYFGFSWLFFISMPCEYLAAGKLMPSLDNGFLKILGKKLAPIEAIPYDNPGLNTLQLF